MTVEIKEIETFNLNTDEYATYKNIYGGTLPAIFYIKEVDGEVTDIHKYNIWEK